MIITHSFWQSVQSFTEDGFGWIHAGHDILPCVRGGVCLTGCGTDGIVRMV